MIINKIATTGAVVMSESRREYVKRRSERRFERNLIIREFDRKRLKHTLTDADYESLEKVVQEINEEGKIAYEQSYGEKAPEDLETFYDPDLAVWQKQRQSGPAPSQS